MLLSFEHCLQASGEAVYTSDVALGVDELYCYPVESTQALAMLVSVDASKALEVMALVHHQYENSAFRMLVKQKLEAKRQNILGNRGDYSGRLSVLLRLFQCPHCRRQT